jgi:hypothetical protein
MAMTTMRRHSGRAWRAGRWATVVLLGVAATCLLVHAATDNSPGYGEAGGGAAGNVIAVAGRVTADTYGLYLVDTKNATIAVYQFIPGKHQLRLMASRTYLFDTKLDEYNTEPPPSEIKKLVEQQKRLGETK